MSQQSSQIVSRGFEYGVQHLLTTRAGLLTDILNEMLNLSTKQVQDLCDLGAIYVQGERISQLTEWPAQTYVRVHTKPRRFPIAKIDWRKTILFTHADFLVINKPAGIPCHASVDNIQENLLKSLSDLLGEKLFITHRLDVPTAGLLVVARTLEFQAAFNRALGEKSVRKFYHARCTRQAPALGRHVHYMLESFNSPKKMSSNADDGQRCELEVLSVQAEDDIFTTEIELLTGRTHQIRAQMSFVGSPLENDSLYGAEKVFPDERIGLRAQRIAFNHSASGEAFSFNLNLEGSTLA